MQTYKQSEVSHTYSNSIIATKNSMKKVFYTLLICLFSYSSWATTFTVSNLNDTGLGSLRQAIADANAGAGATAGSPHIIDITVAGTIFVNTALDNITNHVTINSHSTGSRIERATANLHRVFTISGAFTVELNGLIIANGNPGAANPGGGIYNGGATLTLKNCLIDGNNSGLAAGGNGGGIYQASGSIFINNSTIKNNGGNVFCNGGGMYIADGTATLRNCTVQNNQTGNTSNAGAIYIAGTSTLNLVNCTVIGNFSGSTHPANSSGGVFYDGGGAVLNMTNTILWNNTSSGIANSDLNTLAASYTGINTTNIVGACNGFFAGFCASVTFFSTADPLLASLDICGNNDIYRPAGASLAINNGTSGAPSLTTDICGNSWVGGVEIGSVESIVAATTLDCDGNNDYVDVSSPFTGFTNELSVEAWFNVQTVSDAAVLGQGTDNVDNMASNVWMMLLNSTDNKMSFYVNDGGTWRIATSTTTFNGTGWHHIVGTTSASETAIWVNGNKEGTAAGISTGIQSNPAASLHLGKDVRYNSPASRYLDGKLDEVRIWKKSLCLAEITNSDNCQLVGNESNLVHYYNFNQGADAGANGSETSLLDRQTNLPAQNGTLTNFALAGTSSNWIEDNPNVSGTCTSLNLPEVDMQGNGLSIVIGDLTPSLTDHTEFGNVDVASGSLIRTFTIDNSAGTAPLTFLGPGVISSNSTDFTLGGTPPSTVPAGGSTTFTITFDPTSIGLKTSTITVATNDCNEDFYTFTIQGTGVNAVPATALHFNGAGNQVAIPATPNITLGGGVEWTMECWINLDVLPSATVTLFDFIGNAGAGSSSLMFNTNLTSDGRIQFAIDAFQSGCPWTTHQTNPGVILVTQDHHIAVVRRNVGPTKFMEIYVDGVLEVSGILPCNPVPRFNPIRINNYTGMMDEFRVWMKAKTCGEILHQKDCELAGNEPDLVAYYDFNQGIAAGANPAETTLIDRQTNVVANNGILTGTFALTGSTSNWIDGSSNGVTGTCVGSAEEAHMLGGTLEIVSGDTSPDLADSTDFDEVLTSTPKAHIFSIKNNIASGEDLIINAINISGAHSSEFVVSGITFPATITAGVTVNFVITFLPTAAGLRTATVSIDNSDCDENPYVFDIQGTGAVPATVLDFDGTDDNLALSTFSWPQNRGVTVEFWLNNNTTANPDDDVLFAVGGAGASTAPNMFFANIASGALDWSYGTDAASFGRPLANAWVHVALVSDPIANEMRYYYDGALVHTHPSASAPTINLTDLRIGTSLPLPGKYKGLMDEFRIWDHARCLDEIIAAKECELTGAEAGLMLYYDFNQGIAAGANPTVTTAIDKSVNNFNAPLLNFALGGTTSNWVDAIGTIVAGVCVPLTRPEIAIEGNSTEILIGDITPNTADDTEFSAVSVGYSSVHTFTIDNINGFDDLIVSNIIVAGANPGDFVLGGPGYPATVLGVGGSTTFTVAFTPSALGLRSAIITVNNDDCNEPLYSFTIQGTGAPVNNTVCDTMARLCLGAGFSTPLHDNIGNAAFGNSYGCLTTQPNPNWFFLEVDAAGDIDMSLTAPSAIDYVIWGPFPDSTTASASCGTLAAGAIIDCSYGGAAGVPMSPSITGAAVGDVYVVLVTNVANVAQNFNLAQTGGTGSVVCTVCPSDAGTQTVLLNGTGTSSPVALCKGDCITITSDNNFTLPTPEPGELPELMYAIYNGPPNLAVEPDLDPNFTNQYVPSQNFSDCNDFTSAVLAASIGNHIWLVPITMDDSDENGNPNSIMHYDTNNDGCWAFGTPIELIYNDTLVANFGSQVNVTCGGDSSGVAEVTASGGAGPYTYQWDAAAGGQSLAVATGLKAGVYCCDITDTLNCTVQICVTITEPALLTASISASTNVACFGDSTGTATVQGVGGTTSAGYTYLWDLSANSQTTPIATGLPSNTHCVTITDDNGCEASTCATITQPAAAVTINNIVVDSNVSCLGEVDGGATVFASGGTPGIVGYAYVWDNTSQTTASITGVPANTYSVTVTDSLGCFATGSIAITEPTTALTVSILESSSSVCGTALVDSIVSTVSGGVTPYGYGWELNAVPFAVTDDITNVGAGAYVLNVTDAGGCVVSSTTVLISSSPTLDINLDTLINVSCVGGNDGSVIVTPFGGGGGPYVYNWDNGAVTSSIFGLTIGTYCVTVTDIGTGCTRDSCFVISEPAAALSSIISATSTSVCGTALVDSIVSTVTGGAVPYTYSWELAGVPFALTEHVTNVGIGTYVLNVTDAGGCVVASNAVVIASMPSLGITVNTISDVTCNGGTDGMIDITATGSGPHTYSWDNTAVTSTITSLAVGTYCVTVTDVGTGCTKDTCFVITEPPLLTATISASTNVTCFGASTGTATVVGGGGTVASGYNYLWDVSANSQTTPTATGLPSSIHCVTITDDNACTALTCVTITQPATAISGAMNIDVPLTCGGVSDGELRINAGNGTPYTVPQASGTGYNYTWSNGGNTPLITGLSAGSYCVTVTDSLGCTLEKCATMSQPIPLTASITGSTNIACFGDSTGTATVAGTGGTIPTGYTYLWDANAGNQVTATATGLAAGNYSVTVLDDNLCTAITSVTIVQPPSGVVANIVASTDADCFGDSTGSAIAFGTGGAGGYTYLWSDGQGSFLAINLVAGTYRVTVTDASGCFDTNTVVINEPLAIFPSTAMAIPDEVCLGENINLGAVGGSGTSFFWTGPNGFSSSDPFPVISPSFAASEGNYIMYSEDSSGCMSDFDTVYVTVNTPPVPFIVGGPDICDGDSIVIEETNAFGFTCDSLVWVGPIQQQAAVVNQAITQPFTANYVSGYWTSYCFNTATGCMDSSNTIYINIKPTPTTPVITSNSPICLGEDVSLSVPPVVAANVNWYADSNRVVSVGLGPNIWVSGVTTDSTFYVEYIVNGCRSPLASVTITVNPIPGTPPAPADFAVCEGDIINLFTDPALDYDWENLASGYTSNQQNPSIDPALLSDAGVYTLSIIDVNGCHSLDTSVFVTVNLLAAAPSLSSTGPYCDGDTMYIIAVGLCDSIMWEGPGGLTVVTASDTLMVLPGNQNYMAGDWDVTCVQLPPGCSSPVASIYVDKEDPLPFIAVTNDGSVCPGGDLTFSTPIILGVNYTWYASDSTTVLGSGNNLTLSNVTTDTSVYLEAELGGCKSVVADTAYVLPLSAAPDAPADFGVCEGDDITLSTTYPNAVSYTWTHANGFNASGASVTIFTSSTVDGGIYTLSMIDSNGCIALDTTVNVTVTPLPAAPLLSTDNPTYCDGDVIQLTATGLCDTLVWLGPGGTAIVTTTGNTLIVNPGDQDYLQGNWTVTCISVPSGCQSSANINVILSLPVSPATAAAIPDEVCEGESINLGAVGGSGASFFWTGPNGFSSTNPFPVIPSATTASEGNYIVHSEDSSGCPSVFDTVFVTVNALPQPFIVGGPDICDGDSIVIEETNAFGSTCDSLVWFGPTQQQAAIVNQAITQPFTANYASGYWTSYCYNTGTGCMDSSNTVYINIKPTPTTPVITSNSPICLGEDVSLTVPPVVAANVNWYADSNRTLNIGFGPNILVPGVTTDSTFYVEYIVNGCISPLASVMVIVNSIPATPPAPDSLEVCEGGTINFFTDPAASYDWENLLSGFVNNQQNPAISPVSLSDSGLYTLSIIDTNGCHSLDTFVWVTVNQAPMIPSLVGSNSPVCADDTLRLNSGGPCGVTEWTSPNNIVLNGANLIIAPDSSDYVGGNWKLVCIDAISGCQSLDTFIVVDIIPLPTAPVAFNDGPICMGGTVTLSTPPLGATYTWFAADSATVIGSGASITIPNITNDTFFSVRAQVNGCNAYDSTLVLVLPPGVAPDAPADFAVCEGEPINLFTNYPNAVSYTWTHAVNGVVGTSETVLIDPSAIADDGVYTLSILDSNGCAAPDTTVTVTVNPLPGAVSLTSGITCAGDSLFIVATGTCDSIIWEGPNGTIFVTASDTLGVDPLDLEYDNGPWTVYCYNSTTNCISPPTGINIMIEPPLPAITVSNDGPVCMGDDVTFTVSSVAGATYTWYASDSTTAVGSGNSLNVLNVTSDTFFYVEVNVNGCTKVGVDTAFVIPASAAPVVGTAITICEGDAISLTTTTTTAINYLWTHAGGFSSNIQNPILVGSTLADSGVYTLSIIDSNGCAAPDTSIYVTINPLPDTVTVSLNSPVCDGDTVFLVSTGLCDSLIWTGPSGNPILTTLDTLMILPGDADYQTGIWTVICVDTATGCQSVPATVFVDINAPLPPLSITNTSPVCPGDTVEFFASFIAGATYTWYATDSVTVVATGNNPSIAINTDSAFHLVIDYLGCSASSNDTATVYGLGPAANAPANFTICEGDSISLFTNSPADNYLWTHANGFSNMDPNPVIFPSTVLDSGLYTLSTVDTNGCPAPDTTVFVSILPAPIVVAPSTNSPICTGDTLFLINPSGCDETHWVAPGGGTVLVTTNDTLIILPANAALYNSGTWDMICVDTATGCQSLPMAVPVTINPTPAMPIIFGNNPVCIGDSISFLAAPVFAGATYGWYTADTTLIGTGVLITIPNMLTDRMFYLVATQNGCTAIDSVFATVLPPPPTPILPADFAICEGSTVTLSTPTVASYYQWSHAGASVATTGSSILIVNATFADSGLYTLSIGDTNGCVSADTSVFITVNPLPLAPTLSSNEPICSGDTLFLISGGPCDTSGWIAPNGTYIGTTSDTLIILPTDAEYMAGVWTMYCGDTSINCVSPPATISVVINPTVPSIAVTNSGPVCQGDDVQLFAPIVSGATYTWYTADSLTVLASGSNPTFTNITSDTSFLVVVDVNGCTNFDIDTVTVFSSPLAANVPDSISVCEGDDILLTTTTAANSYLWSHVNGFSASNQNPVIVNSTLADGGIYTLAIVDTNGCQSPDTTVLVLVNALPTAAVISGNATVCDGDTLFLTSTGTCDSIVWNGPGGAQLIGQNISIAPNSAGYGSGDWTVTCFNTGTGCSSISSAYPVVVDAPIASVTATSTPACLGGTTDLTGSFLFGVGYTWYADSTMTTVVSTDRVATVGGIMSDTTFYLVVTTALGCQSAVIPTVVTVTPALAAPSIGSDMTLCEGNLIVLSTTTVATSYNWTGPNGFTSTLQNPAAIISSLVDSGTYTLSVMDANGCQSADTSLVVTINPAPQAPTVSNNGPACNPGESVILSATAVVGVTYEWFHINTGNSVGTGQSLTLTNVSTADVGSYYVVVTANGGCTDSSVVPTIVALGGVSPVANADSFGVNTDGNVQTITVVNNDNLTSNWVISIIDQSNTNAQLFNVNNGQFEVTLQPLDTGYQSFIYQLCDSVCNTNCDTAVVIMTTTAILPCDIPNIFTPNGDNVNDFFNIPCLGLFQQAELVVFNRWGDLVFETSNYQNDWDGTHQGNPLPDGTYFYIIQIDGASDTVQGSVEIRR